MVGEGLGRVENTDEAYAEMFETEKPEIVGVGDVIIDKMVDLSDVPDGTVEEWEQSDWFPGPGESVIVEEIPEIDEYVEEKLPGGRSTNQALAAYRAGADAGFAGKTAEPVHEELNGLVYDLEVLPEETAEAYVFVDESGENRISGVKSRALTDKGYVDEAVSNGFFENLDYLLVSNGEGSEMLHSLFSALDGRDTDVIFDPAPADGAEDFLDYNCISYVTPNEGEYEQLEAELEEADATVIKTSAEGVEVGQNYFTEAPDVETVDTTGAGDAFNGYLAASLSEGYGLEEAAERACYAASLSTTECGAQNSIPDREEIESLLE